ncbi:hypothetical protein V8F33_011851 [Rhypophila sp. PSN 637]
MTNYKSLLFASLATLHLGGTLASHPPKHLVRRDGNERFPFCTPGDPVFPNCIVNGRYVKPDLNISDAGNPGNNAYITYLPSHPYTLSQWTNQKMPSFCHYVINNYNFNPSDFSVYNVTYPDCPSSPWVICKHSTTSKTIDQIASEIGKMPATMRQATNAYLVFPETWGGQAESWSEQGLIAGKGSLYYPTAMVHEHGHAVDGYLLVPGAGFYSGTSTWQNVVNADGYAATAYGSTSHVENFADIGRVVLLENIYPGGIAGLFPGHPNLTQIAGQVAHFQSVAGTYYRTGTTCDLSKKFPYPTELVDVPTTTTQPPNTATATPYGQCGGWSTYTGPTACGSGWSCTTLNPHYAQCTPAP